MNRKFTKYFMLASLFAMGIVTSCTKTGPQGPAGTNGTNGKDGKDGTAGCVKCHDNSQTIETKIAEWQTSVHATGGLEVRNEYDCAPCHTSQGFIYSVNHTPDGGMRPLVGTADSSNLENPAPQNCYTCHDIHSTYTAADWKNRTVTPVVLFAGDLKGGTAVSVNFGKGNLCANCHQSRPAFVISNDSVNISSAYWGPHHGPQANVLGGAGGYEYAGVNYSNSPHTTKITDGCVTCHMAPAAVGHNLEHDGGHNMEMYPAYDGATSAPANINTNGCTGCHTVGAGFINKIQTTQDGVQAQLDQLKTALINHGVLSSTGRLNTGKYPAGVAGAYWNYDLIEMDRSLGVHNADYTRDLLQGSIDYLNSLK